MPRFQAFFFESENNNRVYGATVYASLARLYRDVKITYLK